MLDLAVIGGGAAGFFAAINLKSRNKSLRVAIFEKSSTVLGKVKISGGGRCNVTHACFDNKQLIRNYPRGSRELLSVFEQFGPADTIDWFKQRGISLKTESDGRMFPVTDSSQTIIDCFLEECRKQSVDIHRSEGLKAIKADNGFTITTDQREIRCKHILIASGSSPSMWSLLQTLGHTIVEPVPSLFTFNIRDPLISNLMGLSLKNARLSLVAEPLMLKQFRLNKNDVSMEGPLLITHWGLSGPAVLKLSSVAARMLHGLSYRFQVKLNISGLNEEQTLNAIMAFRDQHTRKQISGTPVFSIPARLWQNLCGIVFEGKNPLWADAGKKDLYRLAVCLSAYTLEVNGKSTNKDEFVTAGGVELKEIDFKTMQSRLHPGLYFAGEVLNIDALTGGFNFQAAWSEAMVFAQAFKA